MLMQDNAKITLRKGELVKLNQAPNKFIWNSYLDTSAPCYRDVTSTELDSWEASRLLRPLDDGGEPRIPPQYSVDELPVGTFFIVSKARACPSWASWAFRGSPKMAQVVCVSSGITYYVRRAHLTKLENDENSVRQ